MRKPIFDAIKAARGGSAFTPADVSKIDAFLDSMGVLNNVSQRIVHKRGMDLIKSFEGLELKAYPDPATGGDPWTIGYGATGPDIKRGLVWTQAQANDRFANDISRFADGVSREIGDAATTDNQFDAMVSMAYNVGLGNFKTSTLLKKHKAGDHKGAQAEFQKWNKANGKVMAGLTRRRLAEAELYGAA